MWSLFVPILITSMVLWLLIAAILKLFRRSQNLRVVFWACMACILPLMLAKTICIALVTAFPYLLKKILFLLCPSMIVFLVLLAKRASSSRLALLLHRVELGIALIAWSGVVLVGQSLWFLYASRSRPEPPLLTRLATAPPKPLVLWILFDELSQDQLFEHRFQDLMLPSFDRFAAQSTTFTHAVSTNLYTQAAVPALMTGLPVREIVVSADGRQLALDLYSGERKRFDAQQTVFGDAQRLGYSTAAVGWYNPYCRLLATVLNACFWVPHHDMLPWGFYTNASFSRNISAPLLSAIPYAEHFFHRHQGFRPDREMQADHIEEYRQLESNALTQLTQPDPGLFLLHIAAPHPEGIYNRHTAKFADEAPASYIDNLALADRFLGEVEETLRSKQKWDQATIVIMGDHSWRTQQLWRESSVWTPEDEIASHHGQFDPRPAYLVKLPNQHTPTHIDQPFDAVRNRALFDQLLTAQIQTPEQLTTWAAQP